MKKILVLTTCAVIAICISTGVVAQKENKDKAKTEKDKDKD
jgi:hypothetical protein